MSDSQSLEELSPARTILIVEDDADIGEFLVNAIEDEIHSHVLLARDGDEALKFISTVTPAFLLLDYQLPGMSGLQLYDQFQSREELKTVPVLFMSANPPVKELELRHLQYIGKPFELDDFLRTLKELLAE
ncbi:MAG TPA: response regulator [Ktedonobacteraceae bacterium]|nr:response regulator [Ktedonobacteraceae bacterium]